MTAPVKPLFPTEWIDLPSKGALYPENHPLADGKLELKYMTAREEDILTSTNLVVKNLALDMVLESLIVNKEIKMGDLVLGDKNAIYIAARILGYGKVYECKVTCPKCGEEREYELDLTALEEKDFTPPAKLHTNEYGVTLPTSKNVLTIRVLTHQDEKDIGEETKRVQKFSQTQVSSDMTTRLRYIVTSVNGDKSPARIRECVENMLVADARYLRAEYAKVSPNIDLSFDYKCSNCLETERISAPIGPDFFWPKS